MLTEKPIIDHKNINKIQIESTVLEIISEIDSNIHLFDDASSDYGSMGIAIFYLYCHQYFKDEIYLLKAEEQINQSIIWLSELSEKQFTPKFRGDSLSNVISSFGKGLLFIQYKLKYEYDFEDFYNMIDDTLAELTSGNLKENDFDYYSGALSAGHYHINKYFYTKSENSKKELQKIFLAIQKSALHHTEKSIYWKASAIYNNLIYLGASHGVCMIINFISKLMQLDIVENNFDQIEFLKKAVNFMMDQRVNATISFFPDFYTEDTLKYNSNTIFGITYGDLGVLYSLQNANKIIKDLTFDSQITEMLLKSSKREMDPTFTYDSGIMYGASGIYIVFKEFFKITENLTYKQSYNYWYNKIMELKNQEVKLKAGYKFVCTPKDPSKAISDEYSLGWGLAGVGISLISDLGSSFESVKELTLLGITISKDEL